MKIVNYFEVSANFNLKPAEAVAYFQAKGLKPTFAWQDMLGDEHDSAFTVAKMMDTDLLHTVKSKLDNALEAGQSFGGFKKELMPLLQKAGWWGKKDVIDPLTGLVSKAQLGSASRLETIFRTNLQSAYAVGQWQQIADQAASAPFLMYDAVDDTRTRPEHKAHDNLVLPVSSSWWEQYMPPNGWNCRCGVIQLDGDELNDHGLKVGTPPTTNTHAWKNPRTGVTHYVPDDLDPGWDHNPGKKRKQHLDNLAAQKAAAAAIEEQHALAAAAKQKAQAIEAAKAKIAADAALAELNQAKAAAAQIAKAEAAAQAAIDKALAEKTPYLAQAITKTLKTKAGPNYTATELLAIAEAKVPTIKQSSLLSSYKQNKTKGKTPNAAQQEAYDLLPEAAQASIEADIDIKSGKSQALADLKAIAEGKTNPIEANLFKQYSLDGTASGFGDDLPGLVSKIKAEAAIELKAIDAIDAALAEKTPYLAQAITKIEKTKAGQGMSKVELLAAAKAKAPQIKQQSLVASYKKAIKNGKTPTPEQAGAFKALPEADQAKLLDSLKPAQVSADQVEAALAAAKDQIQAANLTAGELKAKLFGLLSGHKNEGSLKSLALKLFSDNQGPPTAAQAKKYKALSPEIAQALDDLVIAKGGQDKLDAFKKANKIEPVTDIDAPTPKPAPAPEPIAPGGPPTMDQLTQIGGQGGSNKGGLYQEVDTGIKWYVKEPKSADMANNEVLTGKLYEAAGIEVPEMHIGVEDGTTRIFSKIIDGLGSDTSALKAGKVAGVNDAFVVDAWLANWDVVGLGYDNLMVKAGRAIRIDTGAGLRYRAQGGPKGSNWNDAVGELDSLRDSGTNPQAAAVYKNVSDADMLAGARKVLAIDQDTIENLVYQFGPEDAAGKQALVETLLARQATIAKRFPKAKAPPKPAPTIDTGGRVSPVELIDVEDSRVNGISIATDKDQIEDQNVLVWHKMSAEGKPVTGAYFKARGQAEAKLAQSLGDAPTQPDYNDVHKRITDALISLNSRINKGEAWSDGALTKVKLAVARYKEVLDAMAVEVNAGRRPMAQLDAYRKHAQPYIAELRKAAKQSVGSTPSPSDFTSQNMAHYKPLDIAKAKLEKQKSGGIAWSKVSNNYNLAKLDKAHARETSDIFSVSGHHYEATIDGAKVSYWPANDDTLFALRGRVEIDVPGNDQGAANKAFAVIDELGINAERATEVDIESLYLRKLAYMHKIETDFDAEVGGLDVAKQRAWIEGKTQSGPLLSNPHYQPRGELQAFGHGRRVQYHPGILADPKWKAFEKDYRLYHSFTDGDMLGSLEAILNGGGQMAPSTDKMRRGIPLGGMSPTADLRTGGASYFFTRIKTRSSAHKNGNSIVWCAKPAARMDAISYDSDNYGEVSSVHYVQSRRHVGIDQMKKASGSTGNETIFKDSLSIFDDLDRIQANSETQRKAIIALFKKHGHKKWPDGRPLVEVIVAV